MISGNLFTSRQRRFSFRITNPTTINGMSVYTLQSPARGMAEKLPRITGVEIIPALGMNVFQIYADFPGQKGMRLLASPTLLEAANQFQLAIHQEFPGNLSFKWGGAPLIPFANRITGHPLPKKKAILVEVPVLPRTSSLELAANWSGKLAGAPAYAMHGLTLTSQVGNLLQSSSASSVDLTARLDAGNFNGHWLSETSVFFENTLSGGAFTLRVTATNTGHQKLPMGIGWHPYFRFPSGKREQARLRIPAKGRVLVNNYDDVLPTGTIQKTLNTPYDFSEPRGKPLAKLYLDDCFTELDRSEEGHFFCEILDPDAAFGLRVKARSKWIKAVQVYAPVDQAFVALEPQFNLADLFNATVWGSQSTGMGWLDPGESAVYEVSLEVFVPECSAEKIDSGK